MSKDDKPAPDREIGRKGTFIIGYFDMTGVREDFWQPPIERGRYEFGCFDTPLASVGWRKMASYATRRTARFCTCAPRTSAILLLKLVKNGHNESF